MYPYPNDRALIPLTEPELADMETWAACDLGVHAGDDFADRLRSMVLEIRLHRDAMAPHLMRAARLHTDELGALRGRVAELEAALRTDGDRHRRFVALRDSLLADDICLACGDHTPGRTCQCENDE